jgi:hypothetical protein
MRPGYVFRSGMDCSDCVNIGKVESTSCQDIDDRSKREIAFAISLFCSVM